MNALRDQYDARAGQQRRHSRRLVLWPARLKRLGRPDIACAIVDISEGGVKIELEKPVDIGETALLTSRRFSRRGRIAWSRDGVAGFEFLESGEQLMTALRPPA